MEESSFSDIAAAAWDWLVVHVVSPGPTRQVLYIVIGFMLASLAHRLLILPRIRRAIARYGEEPALKVEWLHLLERIALPALLALLILGGIGFARIHGRPFGWLRAAAMLLGAYILTQLAIMAFLSRARGALTRSLALVIALAIWLIAVLEIAGLLGELTAALDHVSFTVGSVRISLLHFIEGVLLLGCFLWFGRTVNESFSAWVESVPSLSPSFRVLSRKVFTVGFYVLTIVAALDGLNLDLTSLAWFSGAVGLGLGVGLQKVISNLASGFAILADKSIKPGDVIQVGDTYGVINHLGSRCIAVLTRDGIEYLIPNEDLISGKVVNWSYSHNRVRLRIPVGIGYGSDLEEAMRIMVEAAQTVPRVLKYPEPGCILKGFGDSSVDFEVRVWIADPQNGIGPVRSDVLIETWRRFKERGIEIPFPQRVLHVARPPRKASEPSDAPETH